MARTIKADWPRDFRIIGWGQTEVIRAYNMAAAKSIFCEQFKDKVMRCQELNGIGQAIYNGPALSKIAKRFDVRYADGQIKIADDHGKSIAIVQWLEDNAYEFQIIKGNGRTAPLTTTFLEFRMW